MAKLVNPKLSVIVKGSTDITFKDHYIEFNVIKNLQEEPNTCEIIIYNLGPKERAFVENAENQESPLELYITPSGSEDLVLAYRGEVIETFTEFMNPGHATTINCETSKANHREFQFDTVFEAGTPKDEIVNKLISAVGLPTGNIADLDTNAIVLSETLSGPVFSLLERYIFDLGLLAYITDGVLNITSVYEPGNFSVFTITSEMLLAQPRSTIRQDGSQIEMKTIVESTGSDPFAKVRKKNRRNKKKWGSGSYTEYEGVDKQIDGIEASVKAQPILNPDQIIKIPNSKLYYRIQQITHRGNNEDFSEWDTIIEADEYEDIGGDIL